MVGMEDGDNFARRGGRLLRYGMVGGGPGSFIGDVHRKAIAMDALAVPAAGCFSRDRSASLATGLALDIPPDRVYPDWETMARSEGGRPDGIDFVSIVTPNHLHAPVALAFLGAGIHVVCDKPLTTDMAGCAALERGVRDSGLEFCVTYTYTGYPAVAQARSVVDGGDGILGPVRFVNAEYPQQFFARAVEREGHRGAAWRFDPARSGSAGTLGDVGTHVENLVATVTGLRLVRVLARLETAVPDRLLDDTATVMTSYEGGASGLYWACQAAPGEGNDLRIRVFGTKGSLSWRQEEPDILRIRLLDEPERIWKRGRDAACPAAGALVRFPAGHPEGYLEAFANIYRAFAGRLAARIAAGRAPGIPGAGGKAETTDPAGTPGARHPGFPGRGSGGASGADAPGYPGLAEGIAGVRFVEACVASSRSGSVWTDL